MSSRQAAEQPKEIVFEAGYERMKEIGARLDSADVTVAEMCDLYAEGKGLGRALMEYLDEREGELQEIDEGRNLPRFRVLGPAEPAAPPAGESGSEAQIPF
jgi:exonuclease VII small subunit